MSYPPAPPPAKFPSSGIESSFGYPVSNSRIVYVGDLSFFCFEDQLFSLFSRYGSVTKVEVKRGKATGDSLLHGFVEMGSPASIDKVLAKLQGTKFMGRKLRLSLDNPNPSSETDIDRNNWIQVHVSFVTRQLDKLITEELLLSVYGTFGEIMDVTVKRHKITHDQKSKSQHGYGFIYFADIPASIKAANTMKHVTIDGVTYDSSFSHKSEVKLQRLGVLPPPTTSGPSKSEANNPPQHSPVASQPNFSPAPPAVAVSVRPLHSAATNPLSSPHQSSSSASYSRNPPTTVSNPLPPPHPLGVYPNHRQMTEQFSPRGYDHRPPPPPPPPPQHQSYSHHHHPHSSPPLSMQGPPFNVGMIGFPPPTPAIISPATATPPSSQMSTTSPQFEFNANYPTIGFSPHQSYQSHHHPQFPMYGTVSPYEHYRHPPPPPQSLSHPAIYPPSSSTMFDPLSEVSRHQVDSRNMKSRQRQGNLRRVEESYYPTVSQSTSRSTSYDQIPPSSSAQFSTYRKDSSRDKYESRENPEK